MRRYIPPARPRPGQMAPLVAALRQKREQCQPAPDTALPADPAGLALGQSVRILIGPYKGYVGVITGETTGAYRVAIKGTYGQIAYCAAHELRPLKERPDTSP